ncbi:MAG: hypothetical protein AB2693_20465 [Candidatus Thiodiazotropha sp.]
MTDDELASYVPLHGDRVKLRHHLKRQDKEIRSCTKRDKLLTILKEKVEAQRQKSNRNRDTEVPVNEEDMRRVNGQPGNKHASKHTRRIELGWIHKTNTGSVQIRLKKGGGTRKIRISKIAMKHDILNEGKRLFFPKNESTMGRAEKFIFDVWDFKDRPLKEDITVGDMYEETQVPMLRFYLATVEKLRDTELESENDSLPELEPDDTNDILKQAMTMTGIEPGEELQTSQAVEIIENTTRNNAENEQISQQSNQREGHALDVAEMNQREELETHEVYSGTQQANTDQAYETQTVNTQTIDLTAKEHHIRLHRGHLLKELIRAFKDIQPLADHISLEIILPNGMPEAAEDSGGVTRDALSEFWNSFYAECTLGGTFKVPYLRHDFGEQEWNSVGKIIVFGYTRTGYFPIQLSKVFMEHCILGEIKSDLKEAFMAFIPESDAKILKSALSDINAVENDDLLDVLEQHEVKTLPSQDNLDRIIMEIAHKELIQAGMYVIDCWSSNLKCLQLTHDRLSSLYSDLLPTPRRIMNRLKFSDSLSTEESTVANHLKRFIRELDHSSLSRFLRFCTGSNLLVREKIDVAFVNVPVFARRPVAHTCACLLELNKTYEDYPTFRNEFMSVLNSNVWVMEIK